MVVNFLAPIVYQRVRYIRVDHPFLIVLLARPFTQPLHWERVSLVNQPFSTRAF